MDDLAHGQLNGVTTGSILSAHDCFELGRQSYNSGDAVHTVQWMKQALKRYEEEDKKSVDKVRPYMSHKAQFKLNNYRENVLCSQCGLLTLKNLFFRDFLMIILNKTV